MQLTRKEIASLLIVIDREMRRIEDEDERYQISGSFDAMKKWRGSMAETLTHAMEKLVAEDAILANEE